jgi:hypothetical protein
MIGNRSKICINPIPTQNSKNPKPRLTPSKCGIVFLKPKFVPDAINIILFGPGVIEDTKAKTLKAINNSRVIIDIAIL